MPSTFEKNIDHLLKEFKKISVKRVKVIPEVKGFKMDLIMASSIFLTIFFLCFLAGSAFLHIRGGVSWTTVFIFSLAGSTLQIHSIFRKLRLGRYEWIAYKLGYGRELSSFQKSVINTLWKNNTFTQTLIDIRTANGQPLCNYDFILIDQADKQFQKINSRNG